MSVLGPIPHLTVNDGKAALKYYQEAFGAIIEREMPAPDGQRLMHASLKIGDGTLMLNDEFPEYCGGKLRNPTALGGTPVVLHLNVPDCDATIEKAVKAGGTVKMPAMDMFWGDRYGQVIDPFGHEWSFAQPLTADKKKAAEEAWAKSGGM